MSDPNEQHPTPNEIEAYEKDEAKWAEAEMEAKWAEAEMEAKWAEAEMEAKWAEAEMYERREDEGRCPECGYYEYFGEYYCPVCGGDL